MGRNLIAEGAGYFAREALGIGKAKTYGRKLAKGLLEQQRQQTRLNTLRQYEIQYRNWLRQVEALLRTVSVYKRGLTYPGNSQSLIGRVNRATKYKKLETRIGHVIAELQYMAAGNLVLNSELPKPIIDERPKPGTRINPYEVLKGLENRLRQFIEVELVSQSPNWWQDRVPMEVRVNAERRKSRNETVWPWHTAGQNPPLIYFVDFSDYKKIILADGNWENTFRRFFRHKAVIEARLVELEPTRNAIAHSRNLSNSELDRLSRYSEEIITWITRSR